MKPIKFIKELVRDIKKEQAEKNARLREAEAWDRAGRPTGPGCDQSWRDEL